MPQEQTVPLPTAESSEATALEPLYELVLFDDDDHSYEYVIDMMNLLFNMSREQGFRVAYEVDHVGEAVVKTCPRDEAVAGVKAIHSFGPDPLMERSRGSMRAMARELE